jgi:dipeptidase D
MVSIKDSICTIESSARAISLESLDKITKESIDFFKSYGFDVESRDKYPSWQPDINSFTKIVDSSMKEVYGESKMVVIHAGLECGVISQKYPDIQIASIGPTIRYPHSTREEVKLDSVEMTFEVLKRVVERVAL